MNNELANSTATFEVVSAGQEPFPTPGEAEPAAKLTLATLAEEGQAAMERGDEPTEYVRQVSLHLSLNNMGPRLELEFPSGLQDVDERNPLHILAWYYAHGAVQLMPVAIQSWHLTRAAMKSMLAEERATKSAANDGGIAKAPGRSLVDADGKPL